MEKWFLAMKKADFNAWSKKFGISPYTARIIRNRDITEENVEKFLYGTLQDCYSPYELKDMVKAVKLLRKKIEESKKIRIIGDYDADGICATYILKTGFTELGADVDTVIPHRVKDGYGLNESLIEDAFSDGIDTIVTCDNGISASNQIQRAKELGMTVIVTDHHEVPFEETKDGIRQIIPLADAIIDPKQEDCFYPYKNICGAVVAYKLIQAMYEEFHYQNKLTELIQYAALATVCDVMELLDENRILVKEGLKQMKQSPALGLEALMQVNKVEKESISSYHLGFILGPCLNASGRLDTAKRALELLEATKKSDALNYANELKELNDERKQMTLLGVEQAVSYIEQHDLLLDKVFVIYLKDCHESLAGIIAGRIREKYKRPVFVLTDAMDEAKGSGRSVEGYDMYLALHECSKYLTKYGGHKMAAGFSLKKENIELFRKELNENCKMSLEDMIEPLHIDIALPFSIANAGLAKEMTLLEPFGPGNKKPVFAYKDLMLTGLLRMGKNGEYLRLFLQDRDGCKREMVYFGDSTLFLKFIEEKVGENEIESLFQKKGKCYISCAYQIEYQIWRGMEQVKLILLSYC